MTASGETVQDIKTDYDAIVIGAPLFAGYMFDTTSSYAVPFSVFAILTFFGAFLMLFVKKPRKLTK